MATVTPIQGLYVVVVVKMGQEGVESTSLKPEEMPQLGSEQSQKLSGKLRSSKPNRESNQL